MSIYRCKELQWIEIYKKVCRLEEVLEMETYVGDSKELLSSVKGPFDMIFTGSIGNKSVTFEPVPRFTKRPGDFVIQGSNNTLISLGEERGWLVHHLDSIDFTTAALGKNFI